MPAAPRFVPTESFVAQEKIASLDISQGNSGIGQFLVRLYSLLETPPCIDYENIHYYLHDTELDVRLDAGLSQSGLAYWAEVSTETALLSAQALHEALFKPDLPLLDMELSYNHDFGTTTYGVEGGVYYQHEDISEDEDA